MENTETSTLKGSDAKEFLKDFYSRMYRGETKSDSPDKSRFSLRKRASPFIFSLKQDQSMLDLGAGRQIFEKELFSLDGLNHPKCQINTVDIAEFPTHQLLMGKAKNVRHQQADGSKLPFEDRFFDLAVSNMALDLMQREAISELSRVLKPNAPVFLNLHHPFLVDGLGASDDNFRNKKNQKTNLHFWKYLRENKLLFENPKQIITVFESAGFIVKSVGEKGDNRDKWWEVDLVKK